MCGIAGIIAWTDNHRFTPAHLHQMAAKIAHRGPDGQRAWLNHESQITPESPQAGFAFARLSILDLDPRAMQPMTDGQRRLVFNGEIYNFRELKAELDRHHPGYAWQTTGDSEVILRAYDAWGEHCVEHLNGMFAFAIWDPKAREIFLARDRMGQKPLYVACQPGRGGVAFASELAALRPVPWLDFEIDPASIPEYLATGYIAAPATIYRSISKLPPASWMRVDATQSIRWQKYFYPNEFDPDAEPVTPRTVRDAVTTAVRRQLVSDVPIGCFLSGGIDSSIIAAAMRAAAGDHVHTFTIGFDDPRYDETPAAAAVARHLGTEHHQFMVRPDAAADLPRLAEVFGEPFGDSSALPTHYLAAQTGPHVKVALSGDGGDELFGGYDRYRAMSLSLGSTRMHRLAARLAGALPEAHPKSHLSRAKRLLASAGLPDAVRYAQYVSLFDEPLLNELYPHEQSTSRSLIKETFERLSASRNPVQAALATDRITYLPEDLLTKVDRASMLHALEVRSPFMDHDLVRLAAGLSTDSLFKGGPKGLLREAFASDLPDLVFRRPKMGFAVPIGDWLNTTLRPMLLDTLSASNSFAAAHFRPNVWQRMVEEHHSGTLNHAQRLYALLMLELWWNIDRSQK
jgi:asparagine synthase (glutamine-hydrolysing)